MSYEFIINNDEFMNDIFVGRGNQTNYRSFQT